MITMSGLVEGTKTLLGAFVTRGISEGEKAKGRAASAAEKWVAEHEDEAFECAREMWCVVVDAFAAHWAPVLAGEHGAAGTLRDRFVFPHGLGWSALTQAVADLRRKLGDEWESAFRRAVGRIDWERTNADWEGRATVNGAVMNTTQNVRATAQYIVLLASE